MNPVKPRDSFSRKLSCEVRFPWALLGADFPENSHLKALWLRLGMTSSALVAGASTLRCGWPGLRRSGAGGRGFDAPVRVVEGVRHADHCVSPGVGLEATTSAFTSVIRMPDTPGHRRLRGALNR